MELSEATEDHGGEREDAGDADHEKDEMSQCAREGRFENEGVERNQRRDQEGGKNEAGEPKPRRQGRARLPRLPQKSDYPQRVA